MWLLLLCAVVFVGVLSLYSRSVKKRLERDRARRQTEQPKSCEAGCNPIFPPRRRGVTCEEIVSGKRAQL
jgi:hypothetical protein